MAKHILFLVGVKELRDMIEESIEEHINNFDKNDPKVRFY